MNESQSAFVKMAAVRPSAGMKLACRVLAHIVHAGNVAQKTRPVATKPLAGRQDRTAIGTCPLIIATAHDELAACLAYDWLGVRRPALPAKGIAAHAAHDCFLSRRDADPRVRRQAAAPADAAFHPTALRTQGTAGSIGASCRLRSKPAPRAERRDRLTSGEVTREPISFYSE